jgi:hypothetical protein
VHLLLAYPPALAISTLVQRLKGRTAYAERREYTGACIRARMRGHLWVPVLLRRLLRRRTPVDHQAVHRRPSTPLNAGPRPARSGMANPGLKPEACAQEVSCQLRTETPFGPSVDAAYVPTANATAGPVMASACELTLGSTSPVVR